MDIPIEKWINGARLVPVVGNLLLLGVPRLRFGWWRGSRRAGTGKDDLLPTRLLPQRAAISRPSTEPESHAKNHNVSSSPSKQQQDEQECLPETVKCLRENENPTKGCDSSDSHEPSSSGPTGVSFLN